MSQKTETGEPPAAKQIELSNDVMYFCIEDKDGNSLGTFLLHSQAATRKGRKRQFSSTSSVFIKQGCHVTVKLGTNKID